MGLAYISSLWLGDNLPLSSVGFHQNKESTKQTYILMVDLSFPSFSHSIESLLDLSSNCKCMEALFLLMVELCLDV